MPASADSRRTAAAVPHALGCGRPASRRTGPHGSGPPRRRSGLQRERVCARSAAALHAACLRSGAASRGHSASQQRGRRLAGHPGSTLGPAHAAPGTRARRRARNETRRFPRHAH
eukprot:3088990-Prymnesium_polylepis.2